MKDRNSKLFILNYHDVHTDNAKALNRYGISESNFIAHIHLIQSLNIPIVSINDFINGNATNSLSVAFTFDDGLMSQYNTAVPILRRYNIPACFYITTAYKGEIFMQSKELHHIVEWGFDMGSHSQTHTRFTRLNLKDIVNEVAESKEYLEQITGKEIDKLSLPFGSYNNQILEVIFQQGITSVYTTEAMSNLKTNGTKLFHRFNMKQNTTCAELQRMLKDDWRMQCSNQIKNRALKILNKKPLNFMMQQRDEKVHDGWFKEEVNNV